MGNHVMMLNLRKSKFVPGSVVVITGGSSGMGKELTYRYAERGAYIVITSRSLDKLQVIADECNERFPHSKVLAIRTNVQIEEECKKLIEFTMDNFKRLDILVLNAGISAHSLFEEMEDMSVFHELMNTNFFGYVYPTRYALQHLKETHGQIIVMSSYSGEIGLFYRTGYCASKFAVTGFFESLRMEIGQQIDITLICPITVETTFRDNGLIKHTGEPQNKKSGDTMTVQKAVDTILVGCDSRARKVIFPTKAWFGSYLRPLFPDLVDSNLQKSAKL